MQEDEIDRQDRTQPAENGQGKVAVFLDRDGVLVEERRLHGDYLTRPDQLRLLPGAAGAVRRLNDAGFPVIVVTNQAGVARGILTERELDAIHDRMQEMLRDTAGARVSRIYYCPYHPEGLVAPYVRHSDSRKPGAGMLMDAAADLGLDLTRSYVVGDQECDVLAAQKAKCRAVVISSPPYGIHWASWPQAKPDFVASDLDSAVSWILAEALEAGKQPGRFSPAGSNLMRRVFDLICASAGLVLLSPLLPVIALAIKLEDGGPVIYSQRRMGKNFRTFRLYKFRTMISGADRSGPLTAPCDARITRVGRWLRKYKLDELPQLLNVIKGDMQLVGARPEIARYVEMFRSQYEQILRDRPGITDPASLKFRHEEDAFRPGSVEQQYVSEILPRKLELSLEYSRRRSFFGDLGIICHTLLKIPSKSDDSKGNRDASAYRV